MSSEIRAPRQYRLSVVGFMNPSAPYSFKAEVGEDGDIVTPLLRLSFSDRDDCLPAGTKIYVQILSGYYHACCDASLQAYTQAKAKQATQLQREESAKLQEARKIAKLRAQEVNSQIKLPAKWTSGIKDVLSGLSESSVGDGRNRRTVTHILMLEEFNAGRLVRSRGEFLCGGSGKNWSGSPEELAIDENGIEYTAEVTCQACLAAAARHSK